MDSPQGIRISTAAAMALGLRPGLFYRGAKLHCLNLLLTYEDGCMANCGYCGLARSRRFDETFIRVGWPEYPLDEVLGLFPSCPGIERVCVAMVTHPCAAKDAIEVVGRVKAKAKAKDAGIPISVLAAPTLVKKEDICAMKEAGAERTGIAIDAATEGIFDSLRGKGVGGPHQWEHYWDTVAIAADVFGKGMAGIHLIAGLGETEREMAACIQRAEDLGAPSHLFSFFPEKGTGEQNRSKPPLDVYRRIQLARYLINYQLSSIKKMRFDEKEEIADFGIDAEKLEELISSGLPFRTSGCPGNEACISACNRPYGNERPSEAIRNFPFAPNEDDIADIRRQLGS